MYRARGQGLGEGDGKFLSGLLVSGAQTPLWEWVDVGLFCLPGRQRRAWGCQPQEEHFRLSPKLGRR